MKWCGPVFDFHMLVKSLPSNINGRAALVVRNTESQFYTLFILYLIFVTQKSYLCNNSSIIENRWPQHHLNIKQYTKPSSDKIEKQQSTLNQCIITNTNSCHMYPIRIITIRLLPYFPMCNSLLFNYNNSCRFIFQPSHAFLLLGPDLQVAFICVLIDLSHLKC